MKKKVVNKDEGIFILNAKNILTKLIKRSMKTQLNETIDLMKRMNLLEGTSPRQQVTRDEIIDILNKQDENGGGTYVSFIYVKPQSFYTTRKNWRKDDVSKALANYTEMDNEHWYPHVKKFNDDENIKKLSGIDGIIVTTRYNVHWTTPESYKKAYSDYSEKLHNLRMRNGIGMESNGMLGDNHNQRQESDYGPQANQTGKLSKDFNLAGMTTKPKSTCYVVDGEGHVKGGIPDDVIKAMNKPYSAPAPEKGVSDVLSGEALEAYMKAKAELDKTFSPRNFLFDRILSIVATVNGTSYYYINDAIKSEIKAKSDIMVNPQDMQKIAIEQLSDSFKEIADYDPNIYKN